MYASCFSATMCGNLCEMFIMMTSLCKDSDNADIFLKQLIQFYSNDATNLHHLLYTVVYAVLPHNIETVM